MAQEVVFDLCVVGAGPGGYVAALRAAEHGMTVAIIDARQTPGGVCLNEGCIPSKALLDSSEFYQLVRDKAEHHGVLVDGVGLDLKGMMTRKQDVVQRLTDGISFLFKKQKVVSITATVTEITKTEAGFDLLTTDPSYQRIVATKVLLATGSRPVELPVAPFDGERIVSSTQALSLNQVPSHLVVVGGGYIGLELGSVWRRLGSAVTVIEALPRIIANSDTSMSATIQRSLKKQGMVIKTSTRLESVGLQADSIVLTTLCNDVREEIQCDCLLVAVGRKPNTEGLGLSALGVNVNAQGRVVVNNDFMTSVEGLYAIGDIVHGPMLAHKASEEALVCIERMVGNAVLDVRYDLIPGVVYTWPEGASVGLTEEQLKASGRSYRKGSSSVIANGRAKAMDEHEGQVVLLADDATGELLGMHIVAPRASEMIAEGVAALRFKATVHDIGFLFHAHPSLSEVIKEAALTMIADR